MNLRRFFSDHGNVVWTAFLPMYVLLFGAIGKPSYPGFGYRAGMMLISILLCWSYCQRHSWAKWGLGGWLALHVMLFVIAGIRFGGLNPWLFAFSFSCLIHLAVFSAEARSYTGSPGRGSP